MSIQSAGLNSSMGASHSHKAQMESLQKLMDVYKDTTKVTDTKRQDVVKSMSSLLSELKKGAEHMNPPAFHSLAVQAADVLDKIGAVDPEFLTEMIEELTDSKGKKKVSAHMNKRVQEAEVTAASQFLAIHQAKGLVSSSGSSNFTSRDKHDDPADYHPSLNTVQVDEGIENRLELGEITAFVLKQQVALQEAGVLPHTHYDDIDNTGDFHPALNNVTVKDGIEDRLDMGEITGMAIKQQIELEKAGLVAPAAAIDIDPNVAEELTLGGVIQLGMQLREARSAQQAEGGMKVKSFYTAGAHMMDLIVGTLGVGDAEEMIMALLNKTFLSDEDILLIMNLLGDLGFSAPPGLLEKVKDKIAEFLQSAAQNATSPTDFMMIAEIVKSVGESSLGDMFDESGLMDILDGKLGAGEGANNIENLASEAAESRFLDHVEEVDETLESGYSVVGSSENPVDFNVTQAAAASYNQHFKETKSIQKNEDEESPLIQGVSSSQESSFVYNFSSSVTKVVENFIQKELDSTLDNFAFETSETLPED
ncbi:hypothetical protein DID80_04275 [Candidatus Marinamargulisbacteria bacterium SCGC AAA071-K20]|nr:hypothetical protein DID80_04275 [Candidatus Marinamargulisbacteria bacterium SCGC AAA071-K20]